MTAQTRLDRAHAAMQDAPNDDAARLRFHDRLLDAELFLLLAREAVEDTLEPELFDVDTGRYALVFDLEERLAQFVGQQAPYAALSGRLIARMLAGQGIGLGLNLGVAPSETLLPAAAVDWLASAAAAPQQAEARPEEILAPVGLAPDLLSALDEKLVAAAGLARLAYLVSVRWAGGSAGHMLAFVDARAGAEAALAQAVGEALVFSGIELGAIDVAFFDVADPVAARLARVGLRIEIPLPETPVRTLPAAPGSDPARPPKLR